MMNSNLICFDWAAKRLLQQKSNFVVMEGLLSALLDEDIRIVRILESEGNQETASYEFNRVNMLAENGKGELVVVEVQNSRELSYFYQMLYGVSRAMTKYIWKGDEYEKIKKRYSLNIVYFDLEQSGDYLYSEGVTFTGVHTKDELILTERQRELLIYGNTGNIVTESYIIRVNEFNENVVTPLDEWILFLKTGEIPENASAKGLAEARDCLQVDKLSKEERKAYKAYMESVLFEKRVIQTAILEGQVEEKVSVIMESAKAGLPIETIVAITGLTTDIVSDILNKPSH
ncbi:MAG: Rpn family recombination-promoting nuclease/putative transposase [Prevotellaceae bacterium]|nr:Rpn family recombination-promoting nuclease/putative transposase [Prevotellaceae bacterium]